MAHAYARPFYNSEKWRKCKQSYISKRMAVDGGLCEECHKAQGYIVHHKIYLNENNINDAEITLNFINLEYVCKECHDKFENHGIGKDRLGLLVRFDKDGNPVSLREIDRCEDPQD